MMMSFEQVDALEVLKAARSHLRNKGYIGDDGFKHYVREDWVSNISYAITVIDECISQIYLEAA